MHATQHTLAMADTPTANGRLARGQLHRLVRPWCRRDRRFDELEPSLGSIVLDVYLRDEHRRAVGKLDGVRVADAAETRLGDATDGCVMARPELHGRGVDNANVVAPRKLCR